MTVSIIPDILNMKLLNLNGNQAGCHMYILVSTLYLFVQTVLLVMGILYLISFCRLAS